MNVLRLKLPVLIWVPPEADPNPGFIANRFGIRSQEIRRGVENKDRQEAAARRMSSWETGPQPPGGSVAHLSKTRSTEKSGIFHAPVLTGTALRILMPQHLRPSRHQAKHVSWPEEALRTPQVLATRSSSPHH